MGIILKKEISQFFGGATGYLSILLFLLVCSLFLFVLPDNLFDGGYATLQPFFDLSPWVLLFLIPALTMRLFSEEWREGTMEILLTSPIRTSQLIIGKFLSGLVLLAFTLLPTVIYFITIKSLAAHPPEVDWGAILGSYIGLFFLGSVYTAIGIWSSSLSKSLIITFLLGIFFCFLFYTGFDALAQIPTFSGGMDYYLQLLGIQYHYESISQGVIDVRDLLYFLSVITLFLYLTKISLDKRKWE